MITSSATHTITRFITVHVALMVIVLLSGCPTATSQEPEPTALSRPPSASADRQSPAELTAEVRVARHQWDSTMPGFWVNATTVRLFLETPDRPLQIEERPVSADEWTIAVATGPTYTAKLEVENAYGFVIYHSPPQALTLKPGDTTILTFPLTPIEAIMHFTPPDPILPWEEQVISIDNQHSPLQGVRLVFPIDSVSDVSQLTLLEFYNSALIAPPPFQASTILGIGPSDTSFNRPVALTIPYPASLPKTLRVLETHLQISHFDSSQRQWRPLPDQTLNPQADTITAQIHRRGFYALTIDPLNALSTPPLAAAPQRRSPSAVSPPTRQTKSWSNYQLHLTVRHNMQGTIGIILRHQDNRNYYQLVWHLHNESIEFLKYLDGQMSTLAHKPLSYDPRLSYQFNVQAIADQLQTSVNGNTLFVITDSDLTSGTVGLSCQFDQPTCFANTRIEPIVTTASNTPSNSQ